MGKEIEKDGEREGGKKEMQRERGREREGGWVSHSPSTAFRYLPPNSARFSYATQGALFISA